MRFSALLPLLFISLFTFSCESDLVTGELDDDIVTESDDSPTTTDSDGFDAFSLEALDRVNAIRAEGCSCGGEFFGPAPALRLQAQLQSAAIAHSADQAERGVMGHVGSDGSRVGQRLTRAGFTWRGAAENVAWNQRSVERVVDAWKNSAGHCKNLMNPDYEFMGFAVKEWYWTQVFAR